MSWLKKEHKYKAKKVEYDGIKFDSKMERDRYIELKLLESQGEISDLELQPEFVFNVWIPTKSPHKGFKQVPIRELKKGARALKYVADFRYKKQGEVIVEDVKGFETRDFKIKKALFETIYGKRLYLYKGKR